MFDDAASASRFRDELLASLIGGLAAPALPTPAPPTANTAALSSIELQGAIAVHLGEHRRASALARAAEAAAERLQAVMDAVARCEGDPAACADVARNSALARAARAAREAGVTDTLIAQAIALARAGERKLGRRRAGCDDPHRRLIVTGERELAASRQRPDAASVAKAGWESGAVTLVFDPRDADAIDRAGQAPRAAIDVGRFWDGAALGAEGLAAAARLWTVALSLTTDTPSIRVSAVNI